MLKKYIVLLIITILSVTAFASNDNDSIPAKDTIPETPKAKLYSPTIGMGVGVFKFYGDILDANRGNPLIGNIGYDLHVKQQINSFLTTKFYVLFGTVSANERSAKRNLNFKSNINVGGFALEYNFDQFLPKKRVVNPYISLGIESVEFLSKTDLYDANGIEYNYWSDGSIRSLPENDPNASSSVVIERDYVFETDMRELDYDGKGKYPERTFAVPLGIGAVMHLTKNIDFTVGTAVHFTFSDLVDNIVENSDGERIGTQAGNGGNDKFLMSSFSISYNFKKHDKQSAINEFDEDIDYLEFDSDDEDSDGIIDFIDECPNTPPGVEVDEKGCPLDTDKDFVPNFKDDELETRDGAPVTPTGVELTDEMIYLAYQKYMDSTGVFAETETKQIDGERRDKIKRKYKVQIGSFTDDGVDADLIDKFLSIPDVEIITYGDSLTVIAVGDYDNLPDAIKRKVKLTSEGFEAAIVVEKEKDGTLTSVGDAANNMATENNDHEIINSNGLIFRVQLGAFSKKQPKNKFNNANVMEIKGDDGLWKYLYTGSFESIEEAARKKIDLAIDFGVNDAFIVAYENGKRIKLKDAGVNTTANESDIKNTTTTYDKKAIKFKVQIGSYKNQLPIEVLSKFMEIEGVDQVSIENGLTRYTAGEFDTYQEAMKLKEEIIEKGIGGAFVIAQHKDELIPVNKAKELIAE